MKNLETCNRNLYQKFIALVSGNFLSATSPSPSLSFSLSLSHSFPLCVCPSLQFAGAFLRIKSYQHMLIMFKYKNLEITTFPVVFIPYISMVCLTK